MTIRQLQGNLLYHFGNRETKLRPFVFGGMGATFFSADDLESETKFSFGLGGGVKYFPWKSIGVRASFRYAPTTLNDDETVAFCERMFAPDPGDRIADAQGYGRAGAFGRRAAGSGADRVGVGGDWQPAMMSPSARRWREVRMQERM